MKSFIYIALIALVFTSCKKENSIQTFFVEHQERPDYSVVDVSSTLLDLDENTLTKQEKEAYDSLDKLQVLMYRATDSTQSDYETELKAIKKVFKNEDYPELMAFSDNGMNFKIHTIGEEEKVDEILILANSSQMGFAAIRVIGDDMSATKMATLVSKLQNLDSSNNKLKGIIDFMK
jgi:hypothetical protein|tara:strand:- start:1229 stop:1759 length:531 start_codon:yes stop_codon:yes gene_type:complete